MCIVHSTLRDGNVSYTRRCAQCGKLNLKTKKLNGIKLERDKRQSIKILK